MPNRAKERRRRMQHTKILRKTTAKTSTWTSPTPTKQNDKDKETHTFENIFILYVTYKGLNIYGYTMNGLPHTTVAIDSAIVLLLLHFHFRVCFPISVLSGYFLIHSKSFGFVFRTLYPVLRASYPPNFTAKIERPKITNDMHEKRLISRYE